MTTQVISQPALQPSYVFRGHNSSIHAICFLTSSSAVESTSTSLALTSASASVSAPVSLARPPGGSSRNSHLVTADADGFVVVWDLGTRRAIAVWRAHRGTVLGVRGWYVNGRRSGIITHGKDDKLIVWKFEEGDVADFSTLLPIDGEDVANGVLGEERRQPWVLYLLQVNTLNFCAFGMCDELRLEAEIEAGSETAQQSGNGTLIAVPNTLSSEAVDIFQLPSTNRLYTIRGDKNIETGMVMAVAILYQDTRLTLITGYESGHTMVQQQSSTQGSQILYISQPHKQPILSLDVLPDQMAYFTSSADAIVAKHPIPQPRYSRMPPNTTSFPKPVEKGKGGLAAAFASASLETQSSPSAAGPTTFQTETQPLKTVQTKHAGQQGLTIRSDGKIFATAGWDSKIRVYSSATIKEVAVLKWHKDGCYSVAIAAIVPKDESKEEGAGEETGSRGLVKIETSLSFKQRRIKKAGESHWLAAGSKDGKVSLWDVY